MRSKRPGQECYVLYHTIKHNKSFWLANDLPNIQMLFFSVQLQHETIIISVNIPCKHCSPKWKQRSLNTYKLICKLSSPNPSTIRLVVDFFLIWVYYTDEYYWWMKQLWIVNPKGISFQKKELWIVDISYSLLYYKLFIYETKVCFYVKV